MNELPRKTPDELSLEEHRRLIGHLGLVLPLSLYVVAGLRPTPGLPTWKVLDSVSEYYYSGAVAVFTGVLFALSLFLFSYKGYKDVLADRRVGKTSGIAAACVALFPTKAPEGLAPAWFQGWMGKLHVASAVVLFVSFIVFAVWLFRMTAARDRADRPPDKKLRDAVCLACGIVMTGAVAWAAVAGLVDAPIFWPEAIAIEAFAVSWLVKGESRVVTTVVPRLRSGYSAPVSGPNAAATR